MAELTKQDKEEMIVDAIVLDYKVRNGYNTTLVGHSLSYYDYSAIFEYIKELNEEYIEEGGDSIFGEESFMPKRKYFKKFKK